MVLYLISSHPPRPFRSIGWLGVTGIGLDVKTIFNFFFGGLGYETTFIGALAFTKSNWFSP